MKLLFFIHQVYKPGGAEVLAINTLIKMKKMGYDVGVVSMYDYQTNGSMQVFDSLKRHGISNIHYLQSSPNPKLLELLSLGIKLRKIIKRNNYSALEVSTIAPTILSLASLRFINVKLIVGIHHVYKIERENTLKHRIYRLLMKYTPRKQVYFVSEYVKTSSLSYFNGLCEDNCSVIYNSISENFGPRKSTDYYQDLKKKLSIPLDRQIILFCGRLSSYKNIDLVLESSKDAIKTMNCHLCFLGATDYNIKNTDAILEHMKSYIQEENLNEHVSFLGLRDDVHDIMNMSTILFHPTSLEAFGLVLVEALASNCLIITSDSEAIPEVLCGTRSTILPISDCKSKNIRVFSKSLMTILNLPKKEKIDILKMGKQRANQFSEESRVNNLIEFIGRS
ncbi:glycosyltransferase [Vibrio breoganii]